MNKKIITLMISLGLAFGSSAQAATLDTKTKAELLYLIEEEKLAHDVYSQLTGVSRKFQNISKSEITHQSYVSQILKTYGVKDPTLNAKVGQFKNKNLAALYKKIMSTAKNSYAQALAAGVLIEETDIADLQQLIKDTNLDDVKVMANKLLNGSQNHLRAFRTQ